MSKHDSYDDFRYLLSRAFDLLDSGVSVDALKAALERSTCEEDFGQLIGLLEDLNDLALI